MTNWNRIKEIERINARELQMNLSDTASWHSRYSHSAYIYAGNLNYDLNEGDLITVFSQFGEVVDCNLIRDKETGDPKGFAFIAFENQKSTNLAVDNMNGAKLLGRVLNVDHVMRYRKPKHFKEREVKRSEHNQYGDVDEDDETYEERRKKIWDYHRYLGGNGGTFQSIASQSMDSSTSKHSKSKGKVDQKEIDRVNDHYLVNRRRKEERFKAEQSALEKQIEIRKLKRNLLRLKRDQSQKRKEDRRGNAYGRRKELEEEWVEDGNVLRDGRGRVIDIEKELEKRKRAEERAKREEYEEEMREIKAERKQRKLAKKSKSQRLNDKLKRANKKLKKNKKRERAKPPGDGDGDRILFKKRKV